MPRVDKYRTVPTMNDVLDVMASIELLDETIYTSYQVAPQKGSGGRVTVRVWRDMCGEKVGLWQATETIPEGGAHLLLSTLMLLLHKAYWAIEGDLHAPPKLGQIPRRPSKA